MICHMDATCNSCGAVFQATRSDARYCSPRCRTAAYRKAHNISVAPRKRRPLPDQARDLAWELSKLAGRVERLAQDDRLPRNSEVVAAMIGPHSRQLRSALDTLTEALQRPGV